MVHSLPRTRAHAWRTPITGLPRFASHAPEGSSARTQVIERLIVPSSGIGSTGLVTLQPAVPTTVKKPIITSSRFLFVVIRLSAFLLVRPELETAYRRRAQTGRKKVRRSIER